MPRKYIDVQQIDWDEQIKENISISGSLTVDGSSKISSNYLVNQKAIQFDGLTPFDEVTISDSTTATSFSSGGGVDKPFTISMWVNLDEIDFDGTTSLNQGGLYTKRASSPNNGEIYIGVQSGYLVFVLYADPAQNGVGSFSTTNRLVVAGVSGNFKFFHSENTWFHVCITYDGTKELSGIRIYKNSHPVGTGDILEGGGQSTANADLNVPNQIFFGTMAKTNYSGMPQTSLPTTLGGIDVNDSKSTAIAGKLADVCRFNRVLTHTEVQELYNGGKVKNMEEHSAYNDLVHWWKMGDHIDTTGQDGIKDYVGGYHGTLGGDASIVSEATLGSDVSSTIHFNTSGSVGVGPSNPSAELDVIGNSKFLGDMDIDGDVRISNYLALNCDGTVDPSGTPPLVNHAHIYSKLVSGHAELFVQDSNSNVTQISPHNPEGEWQYFSKNIKTGKVVRINMEKMIRKLEEITGESFMEEWYEKP